MHYPPPFPLSACLPILAKNLIVKRGTKTCGREVAQSTYIYRVQTTEQCLASSKLPNYWPTHPLSTQRVCPPPVPKAGGRTHSPGGEGVGGQYFGRRQTLDYSLLQYNPSTGGSLYDSISFFLFARYHNPVASSHGLLNTPKKKASPRGLKNSERAARKPCWSAAVFARCVKSTDVRIWAFFFFFL